MSGDELNDELKERLRLIHGMTLAEVDQRRRRLFRTLEDEIVALLDGTISPAAAKELQREHAQEISGLGVRTDQLAGIMKKEHRNATEVFRLLLFCVVAAGDRQLSVVMNEGRSSVRA